MEQCVYLEGNDHTPQGKLYTTGPGTYKIPACSDIPVQLNVQLMDKTDNPNAIFSSKVYIYITQNAWHLQYITRNTPIAQRY